MEEHGGDDHDHDSRSPTPSKSRSSLSGKDQFRDRSRSRSREDRSHSRRKSHRRSRSRRRSRHHKSRHSRSDSRSSDSSTKVKMLINHQLASTLGDVLRPIQEQLAKLNGDAPESNALSSEMKDLRLAQQRLSIETKAASLSSPGGQSQFRSFATIGMKLTDATESLDDLMLTRPSPEDDVYKSLAAIREKISAASADVSERVDLIFKADSDPKLGWKAVSLLEEKQRLGTKDPEKDKVFQTCLKQVQDAHKSSNSQRNASRRPFPSAPGGHPGYSSSAGTGDVKHFSSSFFFVG